MKRNALPRSISLVFLLFVGVQVTQVDAEEKLRTWTDASGKFRVEAAMIDQLDGKVRLRKANGEIVSVPVDRLSRQDQEHLKLKSTRPATAPTETTHAAADRPKLNEHDKALLTAMHGLYYHDRKLVRSASPDAVFELLNPIAMATSDSPRRRLAAHQLFVNELGNLYTALGKQQDQILLKVPTEWMDTKIKAVCELFGPGDYDIRAVVNGLDGLVDGLRDRTTGKFLIAVASAQVRADQVDVIRDEFGKQLSEGDDWQTSLSGWSGTLHDGDPVGFTQKGAQGKIRVLGDSLEMRYNGAESLTGVLLIAEIKTKPLDLSLTDGERASLAFNKSLGYGNRNIDVQTLFLAQKASVGMSKADFAYLEKVDRGDIIHLPIYNTDFAR
ncbi:MAG: hypothetical protein KDB11_33840, partial [Planctomycetales bacterium]|nr:hypothetical protein [Planctomycetales bacterium]